MSTTVSRDLPVDPARQGVRVTEIEHGTAWTETTGITGAETAPSTVADGLDCSGKNRLLAALSQESGTVTGGSAQLWVWDGSDWCKPEGGTFTVSASSWAYTFDVAGWERCALMVLSVSGSSTPTWTKRQKVC